MNHLLFSTKILTWYYQNKRNLPWRNISDPYKIWISEVILQQTRVDQGISYYLNFIEKYPTVEHLALSSEDIVLKQWQGLGYYSRARNLFYGAKQIFFELKNIFPSGYIHLIKIKGIGEYTASAIASIAFNEPIAAIDGNVYRVLSRIYGIYSPIDTLAGKKQFKELANLLIDKEKPGDFNQALMEFGAIHCKPQNPNCINCIFSNNCHAIVNNAINLLPIKSKSIKKRNRYFNYFVIENKNSIVFKKRTEDDIWKNMFDFPLIETEKLYSIEDFSKSVEWKNYFKNAKIEITDVSKIVQHFLTHQKIIVRFIHITINNKKNLSIDFISINKKNTFDLAVPKIIENYLTEKNYIK